MSLNYSYDAAPGQSGATTTAGNTHQLISLTGTINGSTESANYTYDLQRRLITSSQTSNGSSIQRRFDYDRWGNRSGVWDATTGGNQIQNVALQQSGGAPTNRIQTVYPPKTNFALSANGSVASASSTYSSSYVASATINGDRKGTGWGEAGGGWSDATANSYPDWLQVTFNGSKTIDEIDVFTLQDNFSNPSEPTESMTFSQYGIVNFQVQYWNGLGWATVSGGITGNNKVWKKINFSQITTNKIRVNVTNALANYSRITEVEAWGPGPGTNYDYDAVGNVTNDGSHTYTYDAANRLVSVDGGGTAQYAYDYQNQRVKAVSGGATTHYVWDGGHVIAEHDGAASGQWTTKVEYIYVRGSLIATQHYTVGQQYSTATRYYVRDEWSTRLVLDSSGNVIGRQGHLPFGQEFAETGTQEKHHFTTYEADIESGTDYAVNRQYSQSIGRFQSADPYQASEYKVNPQSWNRYAYVKNDPIHNIDPTGLFEGTPDIGMPDSCGAGDPPPPPVESPFEGWWPGFNSSDYENIKGASSEAFHLILQEDCQESLAAEKHHGRRVDVNKLIARFTLLPIKRITDNPDEPGFDSVFNGSTSKWPKVRARSGRDTAVSIGPWIFIYREFFTPQNIHARMSLLASQAVVLIHEALHMQGFGEGDFGVAIDTFVIRSCINPKWSRDDMAI